MFKRLLSDKFVEKLTNKITQSVNESLEKYHEKSELKFDKIIDHVESLRLELKSLDERLTSKEVRDKSDYGHVQYKLNSLQSELIEEKKKKKPRVNPRRENII